MEVASQTRARPVLMAGVGFCPEVKRRVDPGHDRDRYDEDRS
jgi:hypothetical protein